VHRPKTSRLPLEVKSDTCLPFQAIMLASFMKRTDLS
jgi:hypothetical protein